MANIEIPWRSLSPDGLTGVIEEFVSREGTEYGLEDFGLKEKVRQVMCQLERGDVVITFDDKEQTCSIVQSRNV